MHAGIKPPYYYCVLFLLYVNIVPLCCFLYNMDDFMIIKEEKSNTFFVLSTVFSVFCVTGQEYRTYQENYYTPSTTIRTLELWVIHNNQLLCNNNTSLYLSRVLRYTGKIRMTHTSDIKSKNRYGKYPNEI